MNNELKGVWKGAVQVRNELLFWGFYAENLKSVFMASEQRYEPRTSQIRSNCAARSTAMSCHVLVVNLTVVQLAKLFLNISVI